jgi:deoxyribonuclease V
LQYLVVVGSLRPEVAVEIHRLHSWNPDKKQAVALQRELANRVITGTPLNECRLIAGADVSYNRFSNIFFAGVVVVRLDDFSVVERRAARAESTFPYISGLLSFREAPVLLEALARVQSSPDLILCDGQGIAHPRRLGLASHIGLWLDRPCAGCAKSRLTGHFTEPGPEPGSSSPLVDRGEVVGSAVRTKARVQPVFVSPGHRIDLNSSVRWILAACRRHRLPEPTRLAHLYVNEVRTGAAAL